MLEFGGLVFKPLATGSMIKDSLYTTTIIGAKNKARIHSAFFKVWFMTCPSPRMTRAEYEEEKIYIFMASPLWVCHSLDLYIGAGSACQLSMGVIKYGSSITERAS